MLRHVLGFCCCLALLLCSVVVSSSDILLTQRELVTKLLNNGTVDKYILPKVTDSAVQVEWSLDKFRIHKVVKQDRNYEIEYSTYFKTLWNDSRLAWKPEEYANIQRLDLPATSIWMPDLVPYETRKNSFNPTNENSVIVTSNGKVMSIPNVFHTMQCDSLSEHQIACTEKIGSWIYSSDQMNVSSRESTLEISIRDSEWTVVSQTLEYQEVQYPCCVEKYGHFLINITLERNGSTNITQPSAPLRANWTILFGLLVPVLYFIPLAFTSARIITVILNILVMGLCKASLFFLGSTDISSRDHKSLTAYLALNFILLIWTVIASNIWFQKSHSHGTHNFLKTTCCSILSCICLLPPLHDSNDTREYRAAAKSAQEEVTFSGVGGSKSTDAGEITPWQLALLASDRLLGLGTFALVICFLAL